MNVGTAAVDPANQPPAVPGGEPAPDVLTLAELLTSAHTPADLAACAPVLRTLLGCDDVTLDLDEAAGQSGRIPADAAPPVGPQRTDDTDPASDPVVTPDQASRGPADSRDAPGDERTATAPDVLAVPVAAAGGPAHGRLILRAAGADLDRLRDTARRAAGLIARRLEEVAALESDPESARGSDAALRAALDATLDPVTILAPVTSADGEVTDFSLVWGNVAHQADGGSMPGTSMRAAADAFPSMDLVDAHRRVLATGDPMVLEDLRVITTDESGDLVESFVDIGIARVGAHLITSYRPATDRVRAQQEVRESERLFRSAFDEAPRGMVLFSLDPAFIGRGLRVNAALQELTGYTEDELLGGGWQLIVPPERRPQSEHLIEEMAAGRVHRRRTESRMITASGTQIDTQIDLSVVTWQGRPAYAVAHIEDITERRRVESELTWLAMHDALTGLANRHLFLHHLAYALSRLERRPGTLAVVYVDVDGYAQVTRNFGRDAGDVMLTELARRLAGEARRSDTPARLGGDDFAVLLPDVAEPDGARRLADRIAQAMEEPVLLGTHEVPMTVSIGIALTADPDLDAEELLGRAEEAMLAARERGPGGIELHGDRPLATDGPVEPPAEA